MKFVHTRSSLHFYKQNYTNNNYNVNDCLFFAIDGVQYRMTIIHFDFVISTQHIQSDKVIISLLIMGGCLSYEHTQLLIVQLCKTKLFNRRTV